VSANATGHPTIATVKTIRGPMAQRPPSQPASWSALRPAKIQAPVAPVAQRKATRAGDTPLRGFSGWVGSPWTGGISSENYALFANVAMKSASAFAPETGMALYIEARMPPTVR